MTQQITAQLLKGGLTVDASGNISATKLIGDLQGNVTGDLTGNADTATTATTADSADTLNQQTSINLSGTYSTHQLLVADAYALTGDVTVNDNLILGKLSDDGNDILIEGNYTFTTIGAGKVEAGYVTSSGIGSVDGMTGTLGSGVTLGSGATIDSGVTGTLGSGVSFPAGHVIQTVHGANVTVGGSTSSTSYVTTSLSVTIDPIYTNSMIEIEWQIPTTHFNKGNGNSRGNFIVRNITAGAYVPGSRQDAWFEGGNNYLYLPISGRCREILSTGATQSYVLYAKAGSNTFYYMNNANNPGYGTGSEDHQAQIKATEIKQ